MGNLMFAIFDNLNTFDTWHQDIKIKLQFPLIGINAATNEPNLDNLTTEYTQAKINKNDIRVIAWVGNEKDGLEIINPEDYPAWFISQLPWLEQTL